MKFKSTGRKTKPRRPPRRSHKPPASGLSLKQERFVAEYLVDLNASQAAIRAGYRPNRANQAGAQLLTNSVIAAAVAAGAQRHIDKVNLTAESVLEAIRRQVVGDIRALFNPDGSLKAIIKLTEEEASLIASFEVIKKNAEAGDGHLDIVHKVRLKDQSRYVEMAAKHFRLLEPDTVQQRVNVEKLLILIQRKPEE